MEGNDPVVIPNAEGSRTTPSVVAFSKTSDRACKDPAKRQVQDKSTEHYIFSIKDFQEEDLTSHRGIKRKYHIL